MSITIEEIAIPWETQKYRFRKPGKTETHVSVSKAQVLVVSLKKVSPLGVVGELNGSC